MRLFMGFWYYVKGTLIFQASLYTTLKCHIMYRSKGVFTFLSSMPYIRCVHQIDIITNKKERRMDHDFLLIHNLMFYEPFLLVLINGWPLKTPLEKSFLYTHHGWPCSLCCATAKPNIHSPPSQCRLGASWITLLFTSTLKECAKFKPNTNNVQFKILMMALLLRWPIKLTFILHTLCWNCKRREKIVVLAQDYLRAIVVQ